MAPAISPRDSTDIVGWVQDPNGRGTSSLLISCVLTLGLCVWSALHLNIPAKGETYRQYWGKRVKWAICGVLIPEIVVLLAWRQWTSARRLTSEINKIFDNPDDKGSSLETKKEESPKGEPQSRKNTHYNTLPRKHNWTNTHSFYAGAGGFVFDLEQSKNGYGVQPFISGPQRLTLSAHGVLLLAKCDLLPDIDIREIKDKSKTDSLAKVLVLLQASWMVLQTVGRVATHIPTSLLEVNTIGHILCAFIVYLLWWNKPREIHEPTILTGDWVDSVAAYMYMSSRLSGTRIKGRFKPRYWVTPEMKRCVFIDHENKTSLCHKNGASIDEISETLEPERASSSRRRQMARTDSNDLQFLGTFEFQPLLHPDSQKTARRKLKMGWTPEPNYDNATLRKNRHRLAAMAVQVFPAVKSRFTKMTTNPIDGSALETPVYEPILEQLVVCHARNWPSDFLLPGLGGELMGMALWFATMAYGGVHIAAWNEFFPTHIEKILWRMSSVYIAASGLLWFLMNVFGAIIPWASIYWDRFIAFQAYWVEYIVYGLVAMACGLLYFFARAFLVIDAMISLRQSPAKTYSTPEWTELIPHL